MSITEALRLLDATVPLVPSPVFEMEPLEPSPDKAVPSVPPVPLEKRNSEQKYKILDGGQSGHDHPPANDQPIRVQIWTPAGDMLTVEAKNPQHAAWLQRVNPRSAT